MNDENFDPMIEEYSKMTQEMLIRENKDKQVAVAISAEEQVEVANMARRKALT